MKKIIPVFFAALLFASFSRVSFNIKEERVEAADYYASITSDMKGDTLKVALANITRNGHAKKDYNYENAEIAMRYIDRNWELSPDPKDEDPYMVLLYAEYNESDPKKWSTSYGGFGSTVKGKYFWDKEHIWAKSNGFTSKSALAHFDFHHLRASDKSINNNRGSTPYSNCEGGKKMTDSRGVTSNNLLGGGHFEPIDQYKGDCARALFYMATRYYDGNGSSGTHLTLTTNTDTSGGKWGYLDTLLEWHELDPVDEFELHRNGLVQEIQGNRNPYIDHPEYAKAVFKNEPIVDPVDPTPIDPTPVDPTPVDPTPVDPVDPDPVDPVTPTPVDPEPEVGPSPSPEVTPETPSEPKDDKGCRGSITTTSVVLSSLSLIGICLFLIKKRDKVL